MRGGRATALGFGPGARLIQNQREVPCCVSCAFVSATESARAAWPELSPLFHYFVTRTETLKIGANQMVLLTFEAAIAALQAAGVSQLSLHGPAMEAAGAASPPSPDARRDALGRRLNVSPFFTITQLEYLPDYNRVLAWKQALLAKKPIVAGIQLPDGYGAAMRKAPWPAVSNGVFHAVTVLGYRDSEQSFVIQDSKGAEWFMGGQWYMPYAYAQSSFVLKSFALRTVVRFQEEREAMKLQLILAACACLMLGGCAAKVVVTKVPTTAPTAKAPMDGVYYALPLTALKVEQPIERIEQTKGLYAVFVPVFFPRVDPKEVVTESSVTFRPVKAGVTAAGEPDPENIYFVKTTGRGPVDRKAKLKYTESGTVSGASASADNVTVDVALGILSAVSGIAQRAFGGGARGILVAANTQETIPQLINESKLTFDKEPLLRNYWALCPERETGNDPCDAQKKLNEAAGKVEQGEKVFNAALRAYEAIFKLGTSRNAIRDNPNALAAETQLRDIDAEIVKEMAFSFLGSTKKDTWTLNATLRPRTAADTITLVRIHKSKGICFPAPLAVTERPPSPFRLSGAYLCDGADLKKAKADLEAEKKAAEESGDTATAKKLQEAIEGTDKKLAALAKLEPGAKTLTTAFAVSPGQPFERVPAAFEENGERGFRYRLPAAAQVLFSLQDTGTISTSLQTVAQFGKVVSLPASSGGRKTSYDLEFFEATGALKSFEMSSTAIVQKGVVDAVAKEGFAVLDKATDETGRLERETKLLNARKALYDACKTQSLPCGGYAPAGAANQ